jgi:Zn-dependent protease with chaperone function
MHITMLFSILVLTWFWRCARTSPSTGNWFERWQRTLKVLLLPPLLLLVSSISILRMGPHGQMVWGWEGWVSYWLSIAFLSFAVFRLANMILKGFKTLVQVRTYRRVKLDGQVVRVLNVETPFSAQVGFWRPELIVTQGLLETLDTEHLQAVLAHEQAHHYYRDTFWFFGLGWLQQITSWLPNSQAIWQDLLVLRELRADRWAARHTDSLLLAESLLLVVQHTTVFENSYCVAFNHVTSPDRLTQRIEALITRSESFGSVVWWRYGWIFIPLLPLLVVPLHN